MTTHPTATPQTPDPQGTARTDAFVITKGIRGLLDRETSLQPMAERLIDFARQLERELGEAQKERDFYMSAYSASVNACEFMQEEQEELGLRLGQRTTVEGVACLRRQRDQLRQQLAQAQGAICAPKTPTSAPN